MEFGVEIVPYYPPKKLENLVKKAEDAEFDYLWVSDHYHNRYVHSILAQLANTTEKIKLGPGVTNPYLIHPSVTAAAMATLDELSEGRANLGISAGDPFYLHSVGKEHEKPITTVREAIQIIRALLNGEKLDFSGEIFTCNKAKLTFSPPHDIPIYVGGRGEHMMNLAGEIADGALFNAAHPKDLEECSENVKKGAERSNKNLEEFDKVAYMITSIDEDEEKAKDRARKVTSFVASSAPKSTVERENLSKERIKNIRAHLMARDIKRAREEVSEKMIDVFSVSGTIDKLENRIEKLRKMKISQVVIGSPIGPNTSLAIDKIKKLLN